MRFNPETLRKFLQPSQIAEHRDTLGQSKFDYSSQIIVKKKLFLADKSIE